MLYHCEARIKSALPTFKTLTLSATSFTDAREQFIRMTPGVRHPDVSVCCFNSQKSYTERNKSTFGR